VVSASRIRLRPILMTALATVFGILPIALGLGAGAESRKPLGMAVVGGMLFSTFLTLIVVPVVYRLLARFSPARKAERTAEVEITAVHPGTLPAPAEH
jgi:HAE1 family hydrophobic/amphiphilic exporter-1